MTDAPFVAGEEHPGIAGPGGEETIGRLTATEILPDHPDYEVVLERVRRGGPWLGDRFDDAWLMGFGRTLGEWRAISPDLVVSMHADGGSLSLARWADHDPDTTVIRLRQSHVPRWLHDRRVAKGEDPFSGHVPRVQRRDRRPSQTPRLPRDAPDEWVDVEIRCPESDRERLEARLRRHEYRGSAEVIARGGELILRIRARGGDPYRATVIVDHDCEPLGIDPETVTFSVAGEQYVRPALL